MLIRLPLFNGKLTIWSNTSTLIYGPSGTGKTIFGLSTMNSFLKTTTCMYLQVLENPIEIELYVKQFRFNFSPYIREKKCLISSFDDSDLLLFTPGKYHTEILSRIINLCREENIKNVILDGMEYIRNKLSIEDYLFILHKTVSVLRKNNICLFVIQQSAEYEKCLFDNVIYFGDKEIVVEKTLGNESKKFVKKITGKGIELK